MVRLIQPQHGDKGCFSLGSKQQQPGSLTSGASQPLSGRKEEKRRENWHGRGGGGCGCSIVIEQELLMLNAQAIIAKQPL